MSPLDVAVAVGVLVVGAMIQGSIGFGANLIAAPILALIDLRFLPGPLLLNAVALTAFAWRRERAEVDWRAVGWSLGGRVPGNALGALALVAFDGDALGVLFGAVVLAAVALTASGLDVGLGRPTLVTAGMASGVMGTATSIGGPPVALAYQHLPGASLRASLSAFSFFGAVLSVGLLVAVGEIDGGDVGLAAILLPATLAGFAVSTRLRHVVDRGWTRRGVLALSAIASLAAIAKSLL